eukprot:scaffold3340_cov255-Pinguiococcus_pyrenoidosus.AAC.22
MTQNRDTPNRTSFALAGVDPSTLMRSVPSAPQEIAMRSLPGRSAASKMFPVASHVSWLPNISRAQSKDTTDTWSEAHRTHLDAQSRNTAFRRVRRSRWRPRSLHSNRPSPSLPQETNNASKYLDLPERSSCTPANSEEGTQKISVLIIHASEGSAPSEHCRRH